MKTHLFIIVLITFIASMFCASTHAATEQWSYEFGTSVSNIDYYVDQIVTDGKGGCVVGWAYENTATWSFVSYAVIYFDKKGNKIWEKTYINQTAEIAYCTSKITVFGLSSGSGNQTVVTVDKKGVESVAEDPAANIDGRINSEIGPIGDKKGFFAEKKTTAGTCSLVRYSYK